MSYAILYTKFQASESKGSKTEDFFHTANVFLSSTMQNIIGPIRISHLYRTFFFFIFRWPKSQTVMVTAVTQESLIFNIINLFIYILNHSYPQSY